MRAEERETPLLEFLVSRCNLARRRTAAGPFGDEGWGAGADTGTEAVFLVLEDRVDAVSIRAVRASTTCCTTRKRVGSTTCPSRPPLSSRALTWVICEARCGQCDWKIGNAPRANDRVSADESSRHFLSPCCSASASFSMNAGFQFDRICDTKYEHESRTSLDLSDAKTVRGCLDEARRGALVGLFLSSGLVGCRLLDNVRQSTEARVLDDGHHAVADVPLNHLRINGGGGGGEPTARRCLRPPTRKCARDVSPCCQMLKARSASGGAHESEAASCRRSLPRESRAPCTPRAQSSSADP